MAYESTPVAESTSAIPTSAPITMREERVIDPYQRAKTASLVVKSEPVGQVATTETPKAEVPAVPAETVQLSPQVAALARKEQRFRREEQELKNQKAALEAERAEIAELKALKAKLALKDYSGIEDLVKYDEYTNYLIEKTETQSPEAKALKELAAKVDSVEAAQKTDIEKRFEAAVQERRKAVTEIVESNPEFSSIKELKLQEAVVKHILDTWEHDSIDLSPEDAAKEVEAELLERAGKWSGLSKLKSQTTTEESAKQLPPLKPGIKTLTNNMAATGEIKRPVKSFQNMTDSERYAEARRRAEEKLKERIRT